VRTFVDTNVWVYALDPRDARKQAAARRRLSEDADDLVVSPQVMGELFVTLTRVGGSPMVRSDARAAVERLGDLQVVALEVGHVHHALALAEDGQLSYWDALIVASASAAGCERLLTEDMADGAVIANVRIENPFIAPPRRLAELGEAYRSSGGTWDDEDLRDQLARYEAAARASGMTPNAVHSYWDYARRFLDWREGAYPRSAASRPVPRHRVETTELEDQADLYERYLQSAALSPAAIETYVRHARFFVRWLAGDFEPGARLARR
jgi:predicted nucleic acid-binding protein